MESGKQKKSETFRWERGSRKEHIHIFIHTKKAQCSFRRVYFENTCTL